MSAKNVKLARDAYAAWNNGDADWFLEHLTEDAEIRPLRDLVGFDEIYRGRGGWKKFWKVWRGHWSSIEIRVERMEDMGDHGVLVLLKFEGVERARGAEASIGLSHWLTFSDGLLTGITVMTPQAADRRRASRS
jgi:ketosteroid isomerase-like protein